MNDFVGFPKLARLKQSEMIITEKIDGSNAQIYITEDGQIKAGSRHHWLTPGKKTDNFGFARWVEDNKEELLKLGPGRHFGEWWGKGIQREYGLNERRFSLFNIEKWQDDRKRPECCDIVRVLHTGIFETPTIDDAMTFLSRNGSVVVPRFMKPEGIVIYIPASKVGFKITFDDMPKWMKGAKHV